MSGNLLKLLLLSVTATTLAGEPAAKPKSVSIVDVPRERRDYGSNIGNIKVRFTDGHSETWTSLGRCMDAHGSRRGLVGWTRYTERNDYQEPVNNTLRIRFLNGKIRDFKAFFNGPFIEDWGFADGDSAVVIASRARHGHAYYLKYDIATGKLIGTVEVPPSYDELPKWAQPYADDKPRP